MAVLITGCVTDISHDSRYPTDYVVGGIYRVQRPLVAKTGKVAAALYDPMWFPKLKGISIPTDTLIQVSQIQLDNRDLLESSIWVRAHFVDGPLMGKAVELAYVSKRKSPTVSVPVVDTNMLRLVVKER